MRPGSGRAVRARAAPAAVSELAVRAVRAPAAVSGLTTGG